MGESPLAPEYREAVVQETKRLRDQRNRSTVTSRLLADNLSLSSKEIAPVLVELADEGLLDPWGSSTPQTYHITLEDTGQTD